ncbi:Ydc2-catalyt-domain-containing protein [Lizonia empirigonia]|nr:Ydc2-catalyt-domain-containing protein [Lizonia empirigonia]
MAPKKAAVTADALKGLLTRIGSASSGTKSTLLARFQRDVRQSGVAQVQAGAPREPWDRKLRIVSIDMGIRNLAFCDAEVTFPALGTRESDLDAAMKVLRWRKIDLVSSKDDQGARSSEDGQEALEPAEDDEDQYSPSVLSRTAYRLITEEVLSASPDVILIEKQRWRSGGGSAVQQWTVRVNTLEAMLWAILETLKSAPRTPREAAQSETTASTLSIPSAWDSTG